MRSDKFSKNDIIDLLIKKATGFFYSEEQIDYETQKNEQSKKSTIKNLSFFDDYGNIVSNDSGGVCVGKEFVRCEEDEARGSKGLVRCEEDEARGSKGLVRCEGNEARSSKGLVRCEEDEARGSKEFARCEEDEARGSKNCKGIFGENFWFNKNILNNCSRPVTISLKTHCGSGRIKVTKDKKFLKTLDKTLFTNKHYHNKNLLLNENFSLSKVTLPKDTLASGNFANEKVAKDTLASGNFANERVEKDTLVSGNFANERVEKDTLTSGNFANERLPKDTLASGNFANEKVAKDTLVSGNFANEKVAKDALANNFLQSPNICGNACGVDLSCKMIPTKRKVTTHYVPPDMVAIKLLFDIFNCKTESSGIENLNDDELIILKNKLLKELRNEDFENK